jgi:hypothetical protein
MKKLFVVLTLLLVGCGGSSPAAELTDYELPNPVEVTFNVLVPAGTPAGESVLFTIVDDLTGLGNNPQASVMESSGDNTYAVTLSVPAGTLVKYRYVRQSPAGFVDEMSAGGQTISYRAYLVDGPGHVSHDIVAAWTDLASTESTGQVAGVVIASGSGAPVPNLAVNISGLQTVTDEQGRFLVSGLPQGLHDIVISATDGAYLPFQQGALVAAGAETQAAMALNPTNMATVTLIMTPPEGSPSAVPVYMLGDIGGLRGKPQMAANEDGSLGMILELPTGVSLNYKYTLGDGFWNAEHNLDGSYAVRQLVIPAGTTSLTILDQVPAWTAGSSAPVWFDLTAPGTDDSVYMQYKLGDWVPAVPMWNLGSGHYAYVLYAPTNFTSLEYRYCHDAACALLEIGSPVRAFNGNQSSIQKIEDTLAGWQ